jgi:hypothetical protein
MGGTSRWSHAGEIAWRGEDAIDEVRAMDDLAHRSRGIELAHNAADRAHVLERVIACAQKIGRRLEPLRLGHVNVYRRRRDSDYTSDLPQRYSAACHAPLQRAKCCGPLIRNDSTNAVGSPGGSQQWIGGRN